MGRKRRAGIMLPEHVHRVKWKSGTVAYYYQRHRGTPRAGPRTRLPDNPASDFFWAEIKRLSKPAPAKGSFADMVDAYLASPKFAQLKPNTQREYRRHMGAVRQALLQDDARDVEPSDIAQMRDAMGETPAKANAYVKSIAALYAWGCEAGFAKTNPAVGISKLKIGEHPPWPEWAWAAAMTHFREDIRRACIMGRETGQRLGDILRMKLTDLELHEGVLGVRVVQQKTGKALFVPLTAPAREIVAEARAEGRFVLCPKAGGGEYTVDQFHAAWGRDMRRLPELAAIRAAGLSFHGLRKAFVVERTEFGHSAKMIGAVTGQSGPVVEHYAKGADQKRLAIAAHKAVEEGTK